jgi:hypothetical protein
MPVPAACHDTALSAFAQLAVLRLGARRAFITILSTSTEHVLVEATKTMSLQSDIVATPKDTNWIGTSSFAQADGLADLSLDEWRQARNHASYLAMSNTTTLRVHRRTGISSTI